MCELYNKAGQILNSFSIPQISSTALCDGFVIRNEVYLLDFMECGTFQQLHWCDYACRHMIGENFLKEHGILTGVNWPDKWKFNLLEPTGDCKKVTLEKFMAEPTPFQLDGLLFYHKNVSPFFIEFIVFIIYVMIQKSNSYFSGSLFFWIHSARWLAQTVDDDGYFGCCSQSCLYRGSEGHYS